MIKGRIIKNTLANSGGKVLSFALQLIIITYLIRNIGKEAYGIVVLALALAANIQLLEAGFGVGVTKYIAEYKARGERRKLLEIVNTNLIVATVFAVIYSCILVLVNEFFLAKIFTLSPVLLDETKNLVRILILASIVEFWSVSIVRVAEGFQRYLTARLLEVVKWLLRLSFVVLAVENGYGIASVGIAYLSAGIVTLFILYLLIFSRDPDLKINLFLSNRQAFKLLFGFSIWISLSKIFAFLSYRIDVFLIGIFLSPIYLTYYDVAFKIYEALKFGLFVIPSALVPVTSELSAMTDRRRLELLFKKVSRYTVLFVFPQLVFALFYAGGIINLWIGKGVELSVLLTQLFVISLFFLSLTSSGAEMMVGLDKVKDLAICGGVASFINLTVSIILVRHIGVYGVVIGTLVGTFILAAGRLYLMLPTFNFSFLNFFKGIIFKPLISSTLLALIFFIVSNNLYVGVTVLVLYLIFLTLTMVDENDRKEFVKVFQ
jgi:O-antigen/teichoic acid export membrane protein